MRGPLGIIIAIIVIGGAWYFISQTPSTPASTETTTETVATTTQGVATTTPATVTVTYTAQGFTPKSVSVGVGTKVTFVNQTANKMWVASGVHPTHEVYDGTSKNTHCAAGYTGAIPFDQCASGTSYTFTFTKAGSWSYHNHAASTDWGTVVVTAATPI